MELTPKQQEAVDAKGSVTVTAGAGTGKTALLAKRYVRHVVGDGLSPIQIVAVTFTEKAAAELRSRIRGALLVEAGQDFADESDAAQISTIHSLAARICRDHYDRAGIPPDFKLLDETDADILLADWFDESLGNIPPDLVTGLGYTWLGRALRDLFKDPPAAQDSLSKDEAALRSLVDAAREEAIVKLMNSAAWHDAKSYLHNYKSSAKDVVDSRRQRAIEAIANIEARINVDDALLVLKGLAANHGSAAGWPNGGLEEIRKCLISLRDAFKRCVDERGSGFGDADRELCRRISRLRQAFESAREYLQNSKLDRRLLDFADLEHYALEALRHDEVRDHYRERWKAILVDEFQDTNPVQEKILNALTSPGVRLTIVGDTKQSIYGFRRADPRVFERFKNSIGNDVVLDKTFRTHGELIRSLNLIFTRTLAGGHQSLDAERETKPHGGPFIEAHSFTDDDADIMRLRDHESRYISSEIARILNEGLTVWDKSLKLHRPVRPSDIAILSRSRAPLDIYIEDLVLSGVPAVNTGGGNLLETQVAKDISVLLRFAADPADDVALVAILRGPFFAISDIVLYKLSLAKQTDETWWQLICRRGSVIERERAIISRLLNISRNETAERFVEIADEMTGYTSIMANLDQGERHLTDWFGCLDLLRKFAALGRSDVVGADRYLKELDAADVIVPRPPLDPGNAVSLMTIHAAKGLEWPIVFVPNLGAESKGNSPTVIYDAESGVGFKVTRQQADGTYGREEPAVLTLLKKQKNEAEASESARLLYVALTRAQDRLYLTSAGKEGGGFSLLKDGLADAGIPVQRHDLSFVPEERRWVSAGSGPTPFQVHEQIATVTPLVSSVPATGLAEYSICPKRFKFRHIDGHIGVGEGIASDAAAIGSLTHTALEFGIHTAKELKPLADGTDDELVAKAMRLVENFYSAEEFLEFRGGLTEKEVRRSFELRGIRIDCIVDRAGDDYVLDYKTDRDMEPADHVVQLWTYAKALGKRRAVIAYLAHRQKYEYSSSELADAETKVGNAVSGLKAGRFESTPSDKACQYCQYGTICDERFTK